MKPSFTDQVYAAVRKIPKGQVATYQQIAILSGHPSSARAVGNALHKNPDNTKTPCHRVVNAKGQLADHFAFDGPYEQKLLLEQEGVKVALKNEKYTVNLPTYGIHLNIK